MSLQEYRKNLIEATAKNKGISAREYKQRICDKDSQKLGFDNASERNSYNKFCTFYKECSIQEYREIIADFNNSCAFGDLHSFLEQTDKLHIGGREIW